MVDDLSGGLDPEPLDPSAREHAEPPQGIHPQVPIEQAPSAPGQAPLGAPMDPVWSTPAAPPPPVAPPPASGWVVASTPVVRVEVAPGLVFASTGRRFGAWLIDWIVALLLIWLVEIPVIATSRPHTDLGIAVSVAALALAYLVLGGYFILGWRSRRRATPGMRVFRLQIGNAFDGRTLTLGQAIRRWVVTGYPLYPLTAISAITALAFWASLALWIVLLLTTVSSSTRQGLHDRVANSAVVEPIRQSSGSGSAVGVIAVAVGLFLLIPFVAIIALLYLGGQVSRILSTVGTPTP